jgi:hypothetical protein
MKKLIRNTLATTGLTLIVLATVATIFNGEFIFVRSIYECFLANIIIHIGLIIVQIFESKYFLIEVLFEVSYVLIVLIVSGFLFHWYNSTPLWIVILMGISIYLISCWINIFRINQDITFINRQLKSTNIKSLL